MELACQIEPKWEKTQLSSTGTSRTFLHLRGEQNSGKKKKVIHFCRNEHDSKFQTTDGIKSDFSWLIKINTTICS